MPWAAKSPCVIPGCGQHAQYRGRCSTHMKGMEQERPNVDARKWYHTRRWELLKAQVRAEEPCCGMCLTEGQAVPGTQTDHIVPHRGNEALFFNRQNLQNLCEHHHSLKTQSGQ